MTESKIRVGVSEQYLETLEFVNGAGRVHREGTFNASPTDGDVKQEVDAVPQAARVIVYDESGDPFSEANKISTTSFNSRDAATLAAGATFQGVGEEAYQFGRVGVSIVSDNATDGTLYMEISRDNITWGSVPKTWANTMIAAPHMWTIVEKYFRIRYVNGTTEATNLAIQVQYSNNSDILLAHQLDETLPKEVEAIVVRPATGFDLDAARQQLDGQRAFFFFGFNEVVGTSWVDIHPNSGDINWLTSASTVEIVSSNAADTSSGLGVRSVEVHGLSATGADQDEVIATNGTSTVESALTYIRVNKIHSEECGTYGGSHQGDITCQVSGGGALLSKMTGFEGAVNSSVQYGSGEAGNGYWSVPLDKVMYITELNVTVTTNANKDADIILYERENLLDVTTPFSPRRVLWSANEVNGRLSEVFKSHIKIKSLADIFFRAKGSTTGVKIEVSLDFYLVDPNSDGA